MRYRTIPTNCKVNCRLAGLRPAQWRRRFYRRIHRGPAPRSQRSAKFASIRIHFRAQYDKLGYGRVEILTKPGTDKYHGQLMFNDNNAVLNSRNPFVPTKPDYNSEMFSGNVGGPWARKCIFS